MHLVLQIIVNKTFLKEIKAEIVMKVYKKELLATIKKISNFCLIANCVICLLKESGDSVLVW